ARGIGTSAQQRDPSAADLVPPSLGRALAWLGRPQTPPVVRSALRLATLGMVDHVSLRSAAIDAALQQAVEAGATQLVVLGAGLDGRAWRLDALRNVVVFEVDHPATQAGKQRRVAGRSSCAAEVRFVAVDFEHDALGQRLQHAGHDPAQRTAWIWEGVTPYLHPPAIESTLVDVARRSAPGSRLLVSYAVPELTVLRSPALARVVEAGFATLGEPLHGTMASEALADLLARHGFVVLADTGNEEWATEHDGSALMARPFWAERLVVAESTSTD
ncbi:MAG: class I SAM-dependent methyltransferase, partial [Myxococcales bacterium]|nr:class I SAM-dependent methyltransferase [Myxococcales bacterium]